MWHLQVLWKVASAKKTKAKLNGTSLQVCRRWEGLTWRRFKLMIHVFLSSNQKTRYWWNICVCCPCCQVPEIHWNLSTNRILTMEFIEGGQVNDRDYMKKHDINVNEVTQLLPVRALRVMLDSVTTHSNTYSHKTRHTTQNTQPQLEQTPIWGSCALVGRSGCGLIIDGLALQSFAPTSLLR